MIEPISYETIQRVLKAVPPEVQKQLQRENVVLAGGVIRDTVAGVSVKDIDIFCHSEEQAERLASEVSTFVRHTLFAYSVVLQGTPVQYVFYKDFVNAEDLVRQFDFRACCAGIHWTYAFGWSGVAVGGFHADCAAKVLTFMSQEKDKDKLTALRRALDFAAKGWKLPTEEAVSIVAHCRPEWKRESIRHAFRPEYGGRR